MVLAFLVVAGAVGGTVIALSGPTENAAAASAEAASGVFAYEAEGFRYEYHAPTGHEGLYEIGRDPHAVVNVLRDHQEIAGRCRKALQDKLHIGNLESLRGNYDDTIRRLHALGYL